MWFLVFIYNVQPEYLFWDNFLQILRHVHKERPSFADFFYVLKVYCHFQMDPLLYLRNEFSDFASSFFCCMYMPSLSHKCYTLVKIMWKSCDIGSSNFFLIAMMIFLHMSAVPPYLALMKPVSRSLGTSTLEKTVPPWRHPFSALNLTIHVIILPFRSVLIQLHIILSILLWQHRRRTWPPVSHGFSRKSFNPAARLFKHIGSYNVSIQYVLHTF